MKHRGVSDAEFVGRDADCQALDQLWAEHPTETLIAIAGIPGVGKTELAIQYGRSHFDTYRGGVAWFSAADFGEAVRNWMQVQFCPDRDLRHLPDLTQQVALGWQEWQEDCTATRLALVMIDDVTNFDQQVVPYLPQVEGDCSSFRFLLTGRSRLGKAIPTLELQTLTSEAAVALLAQSAGAERIAADRAGAAALCNRLGELPLAISLAGSWLSLEGDRSVARLVASLERQGLAAPALERDRRTARLTAERGVAATFAVSWAQLGEMHPAAQQLARVLSLFAMADVPWELVEAVVERYAKNHEPPPVAAGRERPRRPGWRRVWRWIWRGLSRWLGRGRSPQTVVSLPVPVAVPIVEAEEAREALGRLSLLQRVAGEEPVYRLHPLLWEFFAGQWAGADWQGWAIAFGEEMAKQAGRVRANLPWERAQQFAGLLPHLELARRALQEVGDADARSAARVQKPMSDLRAAVFRLAHGPLFESTFARARTLHEQAQAGAAQGRAEQWVGQKFEEALAEYRRVLDQAQEVFPAESLQLAGYLRRLAQVFRDLGRYSEGIPPMKEAVRIVRGRISPVRWAAYLNNIGQLYYLSGRYGEAEPLFVRSLQIREQQLGADHPDTAKSLNNLALLYKSQGRYGEAEPLFVRSLQISEQQLDPDHLATATSLNNLAELYRSQGRYGEAEPLYVRSLHIKEQQLGAEHPTTAKSLNNLANLYYSQGRYGEAEPLYARSLQISEQQLGADHSDTATSLNNLAGLYDSQGRHSEAETLYVRSLQIREQQLGADHPDTATSLNNLALLYNSQGRYGEAEPLYTRSLEIKQKMLPENHPSLRLVWDNFHSFLQDVIQANRTAELSDHPITQAVLAQLATPEANESP